MKDGFKKASGCFKCDTCGKLTKYSNSDLENGSCADCTRMFEIENGINNGSEISEDDMKFYNMQNKKSVEYNNKHEAILQ